MRAPVFIDEADIDDHVSWAHVVEALRVGHQLPTASVGDIVLGAPERSFLNRAAWVDRLGGGLKSVTVFADNPKRKEGLPSVQGVFLLFDESNGALLAVIDGSLITKWKTAADSVLGARLLSRPDAANAVIIGAGALASSLAQAYAAMMPNLKAIAIWARNPKSAQALAASIDDNRVVAAAGDLEETIRAADIISTATSSHSPVIKGKWIGDGAHVDLVGAFRAEMREADDELIKKGRIFVDCFDTTLDHIGELLIPLNSGVLARSDIAGDLYALVGGRCGRENARDITVFKNGGGAHLDLMTARVIFERYKSAQTRRFSDRAAS